MADCAAGRPRPRVDSARLRVRGVGRWRGGPPIPAKARSDPLPRHLARTWAHTWRTWSRSTWRPLPEKQPKSSEKNATARIYVLTAYAGRAYKLFAPATGAQTTCERKANDPRGNPLDQAGACGACFHPLLFGWLGI